MTTPEIERVRAAVGEYLGQAEECYARTNTDRYTSNFYGDGPVCEFDADGLVGLIEMYWENYGWQHEEEAAKMAEDGYPVTDPLDAVIESILADMTKECPEV